MTAIEKLNQMACEYTKQKRIVTEECSTLDAATKLLKKWDESRLVDAICHEAKCRAIKILGV